MGAKLSKKVGKVTGGGAEVADKEPELTTFDKTATLPASFRRRTANPDTDTAVTRLKSRFYSYGTLSFLI